MSVCLSVYLSVHLSVCRTRALWQNWNKYNTKFVYLGSLITEDGRCSKEIKEELPQERRHLVKKMIYCVVP